MRTIEISSKHMVSFLSDEEMKLSLIAGTPLEPHYHCEAKAKATV